MYFSSYKKYIITLILLASSLKAAAADDPRNSQMTPETTREKLLMLFSGEWVSRGLYVVTKLEIADHLSTPKSIEELANLTSSDPDSLYRLMHMLAGFNIFEEVHPRVFANTETSSLLVKTHPNTLHALSLFYGEDVHKSWDKLLNSVQEGVTAFQLTYKQPFFDYFKDNPARSTIFQEAMKEKSRIVANSAISAYDFGQFNLVCDVGGGYGQFMKALTKVHPNISSIVFDLPEVIEDVPEENYSNGRIKFCAGDFFNAVPEGADAYLLKSVLHDWDDAKAGQILKTCHQAMKPESRLLIVEMVLQPKDKSIYANCMDILMLTVTGGEERTAEGFKELLQKAGFALENIHSTSTEFSILEAKKV